MAERNTLIQLIIGARDQASGVIRRFTDSLTSVKTVAAGVAASIAGYFGATAVANFFQGAIDSGKEFEAQLSRNRSILTGSPEAIDAAMAKVRAAAEEMGAKTQFTATQAAEGLQILQQAGLDTEEAIAALPTVLDTATGAGISLAEAADRLLGSMGNLRLSVEDFPRIADVLTATGQKANTNFQELAEAVNVAGANAVAFGLDAERTAAVLGKLADGALRGSEAGTALRNLLGELRNTSSTAAVALNKAGQSTEDLGSVLKFLASGSVQAQKAYFSFTEEARRAIDILIGQGGIDAVNQLDAQLRQVEGTAANAATTMQDNLQGALTGLGSAWDALRRRLVDPLLKPIAKQVRDLSAAISTATTDGTIDGFRDSILEAFNKGTEAVRSFIGSFDFKAAADRLGEFTKNTVSQLGEMASKAETTANILGLVWNGFRTGVEAAGTGVAKLGEGVVKLNQKIVQAMVDAGALPQEAADQFAKAALFMETQADAFADATVRGAGRVKAAWEDLIGTAEDTRKAHLATADTAEEVARRQVQALEPVSEAYRQAKEEVDKARETLRALFAAENADPAAIVAAIDAVHEAEQRLANAAIATREELEKPVTPGLDPAKTAATETANELEKTREKLKAVELAYKQLGITSQTELDQAAAQAKISFETIRDSGVASAGDIQRAFEAWAAAERAAVADSTETQQQAVESMLATEAAALQIAAAHEEAGLAAKQSAERQITVLREVKQEAEETGEGIRESADSAGGFRDVIAGIAQGVFNLSRAAGEAFVGMSRDMGDTSQEAAALAAEMQRVDEILRHNRDTVSAVGIAFGRYVEKAWEAHRAFYEQRLEAQRMEDALRAALETGTLSAYQLEQAVAATRDRFHLLDAEQLHGLQSAIEEARQRLVDLQAEALRAKEELSGIGESLQDELDRLAGRQEAIEKRRFQEQLERIAELEKAAGDAASSEAAQARDLAQKLHQEKLEQIQKEAQERARAEKQAAESASRGASSSRSGAISAPSGATAIPMKTVRLELAAGGTNVVATLENDEQVNQLINVLGRAGLRVGSA